MHTGFRPPEVRSVLISVESAVVEGAGEVVVKEIEEDSESSETVVDVSAIVGTAGTEVETPEISTEEPSAKGVIAASVVATRRRERRDNLRKECRDANTAILVREVGK